MRGRRPSLLAAAPSIGRAPRTFIGKALALREARPYNKEEFKGAAPECPLKGRRKNGHQGHARFLCDRGGRQHQPCREPSRRGAARALPPDEAAGDDARREALRARQPPHPSDGGGARPQGARRADLGPCRRHGARDPGCGRRLCGRGAHRHDHQLGREPRAGASGGVPRDAPARDLPDLRSGGRARSRYARQSLHRDRHHAHGGRAREL